MAPNLLIGHRPWRFPILCYWYVALFKSTLNCLVWWRGWLGRRRWYKFTPIISANSNVFGPLNMPRSFSRGNYMPMSTGKSADRFSIWLLYLIQLPAAKSISLNQDPSLCWITASFQPGWPGLKSLTLTIEPSDNTHSDMFGWFNGSGSKAVSMLVDLRLNNPSTGVFSWVWLPWSCARRQRELLQGFFRYSLPSLLE